MNENLEKRVQALEDILAIQHLKHAYLNACDAKDVQAMIETFVISNCKIDYGPVGSFTNRDDLAKVFQEAACHDYMLESHHAHNPIIKIIDANHATGHWSLTYNLINTIWQKFFKRQHVMTTCLNLIMLTTQLLKLSMPTMQLAIGR